MKPGTLVLIPNLLGVVPPENVLPALTIAKAKTLRHFAVETPKVARQFLATLQMPVPISSLLITEIPTAQLVMTWLAEGHDVGVVSDAGCPGTADPGAVLVAHAHRANIRVLPLVGPSAVLLALMASGMNGQSWRFHGYLPTNASERTAALKIIENDIRASGTTHAFIETPYRNAQLIAAIRNAVKGNVALCVAQNLTCHDEKIASIPLSSWTDGLAQSFAEKKPSLYLLGTQQR